MTQERTDKAWQWWNRIAGQQNERPRTQLNGFNFMPVGVQVTVGGRLEIEKACVLEKAEALALADWIYDTFKGDGE